MQKKTQKPTVNDGQEQDSPEKKASRLAWLKARLKKLYEVNPHVGLLKMQIAEIEEGAAVIHMPVIRTVHGNLYGVLHGGAMASLADTTMGLACFTCSKRVVTLDMSVNYIASAGEGDTVRAAAKVAHRGKTTMVVDAEMTDSGGRLLAKARGTFFVVGEFEYTED